MQGPFTLKERFYRFFIGNPALKNEYWSEFRVLVLFTLGFTIAFTWRQTIFDSTKAVVQFVTNIQSSTALSWATSITTTVVCLIVIYIVSRIRVQNR